MVSQFKNEALTDFSRTENRSKMEAALTKVESLFGREYPINIEGVKIRAEQKIRSVNPSNKNQVVGIAQKGTAEHAQKAIETASRTFETWKNTAAPDRANYLFKMAALMRERKFELAATMTFEVGKSWAEADGDVAEAIDFCEFYGREALRYAETQQCVPWPGERNELVYIPLGVGVVIPPWNFPLAILVGMATAALVTGNTVVLKPASDTPVIAAKFMEIVEEVGLPAGVVNFVTGSGSDIGEVLIKHPKVRFITFTGSKEVGLHIVEEAAKINPGQNWIKRVIAEMGGKDAIIVDEEADVEAAVEGVALSAFGFQGQKCSACSRAIVSDKIYDSFVEKLAARVKKISIGPAKDGNNYMGPVSSQSAFDKVMGYIETGRKEGRLVCGGEALTGDGFFIQPTVFADSSPTAKIAQEEIFGPVLAVIRSKDFDDALKIANNTPYGLTGALYTKNAEKIERARRDFFVGNLYFNRKCTGALVGVQPFGGFNMSGTDSKAGGRDYLLLFLQAKSICQKL